MELLDLQAGAVIPRRCKEAISEPFKGWDGDILHNTLGCPVQRGRYLIKSSQIQCVFFVLSASVFLPRGHLSLILVATVIRYVNDLSLSQMQQINQGQWVPFRSRTGEGGWGGHNDWGMKWDWEEGEWNVKTEERNGSSQRTRWGGAEVGMNAQTGQWAKIHHLQDYSIHPAFKYCLVIQSNIGNIRTMLKFLLV